MRPLDLGLDLGGVRGAGEQHELHLGRQLGGGAQEVGQPLLPGDPPDEDDAGPVGVDTVPAHDVLVALGAPQLGVDAVVHHLDPVGVDATGRTAGCPRACRR